MATNSSQSPREKELVTRLHKLIVSKQVLTEVRQSDPNLGISVINVKQGNKQIAIPLVDGNTSLTRNKF